MNFRESRLWRAIKIKKLLTAKTRVRSRSVDCRNRETDTATDEDNFIYLSTPAYIGYFAENGFNVVQKTASRLEFKQCTVDDDPISVFSALASIPDSCLEADGVSGYARRSRMFEGVWSLSVPGQKTVEKINVAAKK